MGQPQPLFARPEFFRHPCQIRSAILDPPFKLVVGLPQRFLSLFPVGDVLNHTDRINRRAHLITDQRHRELAPDHLAVFAEVAFFNLVLWDFAVPKTYDQGMIRVPIVGVCDSGDTTSHDFVLCIT